MTNANGNLRPWDDIQVTHRGDGIQAGATIATPAPWGDEPGWIAAQGLFGFHPPAGALIGDESGVFERIANAWASIRYGVFAALAMLAVLALLGEWTSPLTAIVQSVALAGGLGALVVLGWVAGPTIGRACGAVWPAVRWMLLVAAGLAFLFGAMASWTNARADEHGIASVYTTKTGTKTASGKRLHDGAMTAAHKSLPFGTRVQVTNKRNGKSIVVTITDRGPFIRGRIIDLTMAGANAIGMGYGIAPVVIRRL